MRLYALLAALLALLIFALAARGQEPAPAASLYAIVAALDSPDFKVREGVTVHLASADPQTWHLLARLRNLPTEEVRQRVKYAVGKLWLRLPLWERQDLAAKLLPAGQLRLPVPLHRLFGDDGGTTYYLSAEETAEKRIEDLLGGGAQLAVVQDALDRLAEDEELFWADFRETRKARRRR